VRFSGVWAALPAGSNIEAFDRQTGAGALFAVDTPVDLGQGLVARPGDVIRARSDSSSVVFSASAFGLSPGARIDAIGEYPDGDLLLSFDVATEIAAGAIGVVDDEDLVRVDLPTGAVSMAFEASSWGIDPALDLDAADVWKNGRLLLSFDGSGRVDGIDFADEDALLFDPATGAFSLVYDGSAEHPAWTQTDLDAIDASPDSDGDGLTEALDVCPFWAQASSSDRDGDFRGDECECGDQNGDGLNSVSDLIAINGAIFDPDPGSTSPLCDAQNDGNCTVSDILAVNFDLFAPGSRTTCARQRLAGP
jgi:hypothetical protein